MNKRNEEIKEFLKKYSDVLKALGMDVANSQWEDRWFVFKYNSIFSSNYEFFIEINSGEQLVDCIISELSYEMHSEIGVDDVDTPESEKNNISEMIEQYRTENGLATLTAVLSYIKENVTEKDSKLIKTLEELVM